MPSYKLSVYTVDYDDLPYLTSSLTTSLLVTSSPRPNDHSPKKQVIAPALGTCTALRLCKSKVCSVFMNFPENSVERVGHGQHGLTRAGSTWQTNMWPLKGPFSDVQMFSAVLPCFEVGHSGPRSHFSNGPWHHSDCTERPCNSHSGWAVQIAEWISRTFWPAL